MTDKRSDIEIFKENLKGLELSLLWLKQSYSKCSLIIESNDFSEPNNFEALEALTSRFARVCDVLTNKVYRGIALIEMSNAKNLIEAIDYLEKTGVVDSFKEIRLLKELRNDIVHEYIQNDLFVLFRNIYSHTSLLISLTQKAIIYGNNLILKL